MESSSVRISSAESTDVSPFLTLWRGASDRMRGIDRDGLPGHQPIRQHADSGQVLLDRRLTDGLTGLLDAGTTLKPLQCN